MARIYALILVSTAVLTVATEVAHADVDAENTPEIIPPAHSIGSEILLQKPSNEKAVDKHTAGLPSNEKVSVSENEFISRPVAQGVIAMKNGTTLLAPNEHTVVQTPYGTVAMGADSLVLVVSSEPCLGVYSLVGNNTVDVRIDNHKFLVKPGHCIVTSKSQGKFEEINPCQSITYRNLRQRLFGRQHKVFEAEFDVRLMVLSLPLYQDPAHLEETDRKMVYRALANGTQQYKLLKPGMEPFSLYPNPAMKDKNHNEIR